MRTVYVFFPVSELPPGETRVFDLVADTARFVSALWITPTHETTAEIRRNQEVILKDGTRWFVICGWNYYGRLSLLVPVRLAAKDKLSISVKNIGENPVDVCCGLTVEVA